MENKNPNSKPKPRNNTGISVKGWAGGSVATVHICTGYVKDPSHFHRWAFIPQAVSGWFLSYFFTLENKVYEAVEAWRDEAVFVPVLVLQPPCSMYFLPVLTTDDGQGTALQTIMFLQVLWKKLTGQRWCEGKPQGIHTGLHPWDANSASQQKWLGPHDINYSFKLSGLKST